MPAADEYLIFLSDTREYGGAERCGLALSRWLHDHSIPHRLVMYEDRIGFQKYASHPLNITVLHPKDTALGKIAAMRRFIHSLPANNSKLLFSGFQPALHASIAGARGFHCLMHDTETLFSGWGKKQNWKQRLRGSLYRHYLRKGLESGGKTIVASEFLKADSARLYGGDVVICRIGGMADAVAYSPRVVESGAVHSGLAKRRLRLLSVSRVEANKRIDWIIRSLAALENQAPALSEIVDWHLDVVGKGSWIPALQQLAADLKVQDRITFHGFVGDEKLISIYDQSHLFLMPARQGYGIPALEALYRGIPVLLHRESGVSDILLDTPWATVIDGGEENLPAALQSAVRSLLEKKHLAVPRLDLPTEDSWAACVAGHCGWI